MSNLTVAVIQSDIIWENKTANYEKFEQLIDTLKNCDLIVLPEMFNVGFTPNTNKMITNQGEIIKWLTKQANYKKSAIIGSVVVRNNVQKLVNRLFFITPSGKFVYYDKVHLFTLSNEHQILTSGKSRKIILYKGFNILVSICFDLRFPVFNCNNNDYDLLINIANWPAKRRAHWLTLLKSRAIENQAYVVGCNRIGIDGLDINYSGDSTCINFDGECKVIASMYKSEILYCTFNKNLLKKYRKEFDTLSSQDKFTLTE